MRPIVSGCEGLTEGIGRIVDHYLQPIVRETPAYIKDTDDFLRLVESTALQQEDWLVTIDVKALYTSIPHVRGMETACRYIDRYYDSPRLTQRLGALMSHILNNSVFEFNGDFYRQIKGTAMGTKMAPAYAGLFMADFEQRFLESTRQQTRGHLVLWQR